ncbi:hypothetical protein QJS83_01665 [Bdellovibrio sp. 22V]|uniref:hypothetical protein n=1 Tax=Bdellovibrio TaxID=958 RepID=UPI00254286B8|nr:hypothetical protein [Bdellovibrio sp. 22V]WII72576.1 hypothetical protein QJS83_01665 [Bdellovibrio sp. 22V]
MKANSVFLLSSFASLFSYAGDRSPIVLPAMEDQKLQFGFGDISVGETYYTVLDITAPETTAIIFSQVAIKGTAFSAKTNCPKELPAGEKCSIFVYFTPSEAMEYFGELAVATNLGKTLVRFTGKGLALNS